MALPSHSLTSELFLHRRGNSMSGERDLPQPINDPAHGGFIGVDSVRKDVGGIEEEPEDIIPRLSTHHGNRKLDPTVATPGRERFFRRGFYSTQREYEGWGDDHEDVIIYTILDK